MPDIMHGAFEWDEDKNLSNFCKHSIWFEEAVAVYNGVYLEKEIFHDESGETRQITVGRIRDKEFVIISTPRGERRRIISARRAHDNERKLP